MYKVMLADDEGLPPGEELGFKPAFVDSVLAQDFFLRMVCLKCLFRRGEHLGHESWNAADRALEQMLFSIWDIQNIFDPGVSAAGP